MMSEALSRPCTAFCGHRLLVAGPLVEVALAVRNALDGGAADALLTFDDATGRVIDLDLRGSKAEIIARLAESAPSPREARHRGTRRPAHAEPAEAPASAPEPRGRGRPRLGVVSREITLLPRHWDWLQAQPGGASAALRRLVDAARRQGDDGQQHRRAAHEAAYRFMAALAGDLPGFEDATRALFADDRGRLAAEAAAWPDDVRTYALRLAFPEPAAP